MAPILRNGYFIMSGGLDLLDQTDAKDARLGYWRFNSPDWQGEQGQLPVQSVNLQPVSSWSGNAVQVDSQTVANLKYSVLESNGSANFNCRNGTVRFWFKPSWASGAGPGSLGRLTELGQWSADANHGLWSLHLNQDGTSILFETQADGISTTHLSAPVNLTANEWHQIALVYSPTYSILYVDGFLAASGSGVEHYPNPTVRVADGFNIGSDRDGSQQARGCFEELETFNYQLSADDIARSYDAVMGLNSSTFSVTFPNDHVNYRTVVAQISGGPGIEMAILLNSEDYDLATWGMFNDAPTVELPDVDGQNDVWFGFKDIFGKTVWKWSRITLDRVPPAITPNDALSTTTSQPFAQIKGVASEPLRQLRYDLVNANGVFENQQGFVYRRNFDLELMEFTSTEFQCYDVELTEGNNTVTLRVEDLAGNVSEPVTISYLLDYSTDVTPP